MTTQTEALKLALEALELIAFFKLQPDSIQSFVNHYTPRIKEALKDHIEDNLTMVAQQSNEQVEPVAWRWLSSKTWKQWSLSDDKKLVAEAVEWLGEEKVQPLYTTPPQRTAAEGEDTRRAWVGLSDEEELKLAGMMDKSRHWLVAAVEAKLKEKNT